MAKMVKRYELRDTSGGICQFEELARENQFADANNMWAPDGIAETRPGLTVDGLIPDGQFFNVHFVGGSYGGVEWNVAGVGTNARVANVDISGNFFLYNSSGSPVLAIDDGSTNTRFGLFPGGEIRIRCPVPIVPVWATFLCWSALFPNPKTQGTSSGVFEYWNGTAWVSQAFSPDTLPYWQKGNNLGNDGYYWLRTFVTQPYVQLNVDATGIYVPLGTDFGMEFYSYQFNLSGIEQAVYNNGVNYLYVTNNDLNPNVAPFPPANSYRKVGNDVGGELTITADPDVACAPPSVAVLPEYNTAFLAYNGTVYECPLNSVPVVADIERRDEIVYKVNGIKSPYYDGRDNDVVSLPNQPGFVPQLTAYPQADHILYHQGQVFVAKGHELRWSAPATDGAYKVWPSYAFELISTSEDDSEITAIKAFQENIVVFKRRSVWLATYSGLNFLNLPMYKLVKVVSGVGCVAHDGCAYLGDGRLVFPAEDGFYAFNGATAEKLSRDIDLAYAEINPNRLYKMSGCTWRAKNFYLCAAPVNGENVNSRVFAYDYKRGAWWLWDVPDNIVLNTALDPTSIEKVISGRANGVLAKFSGITDFSSLIPTVMKTWRLADDGVVKTFRELRINMDQVVNEITVECSVGDELPDPTTNTMDFTSSLEAKYGTARYGTDTYRPVMRRERRLDIRRTGRWASLKLSSNVAAPTRFCNMSLTAIIEGNR